MLVGHRVEAIIGALIYKAARAVAVARLRLTRAEARTRIGTIRKRLTDAGFEVYLNAKQPDSTPTA